MSEWPTREITDPRMLRALAHPVRIKLVNALVVHGPATATELADRIADTPANCSWHLRQLAKFGFIEEADDLETKGRNRPWRWVPVGNRWGEPGDSSELLSAGNELTNTVLGFELAERNAWDERRAAEPAQWQSAAFTMQSMAWLTADELDEIHQQIHALILRHLDRLTDPSTRPEGARPIRFIAWGVPSR
ncbi:winged helix-turn-helix domain-containing protein [Allorhizocola rhizosphaerae]|uniref:winged helix-turn-helix domain-containing protein n=1 Tax=Allorhizocola rhizosphaerae TaxID=1872709 RepID=UPI000E3E00FD|nr:helix-turn-helix domain-containing protein [Allorhizocola rhizosphaerae]